MKPDTYRANHTCSNLLSWCAFDLELMCGQFDTDKLQFWTSPFQEIFRYRRTITTFRPMFFFYGIGGLDHAYEGHNLHGYVSYSQMPLVILRALRTCKFLTKILFNLLTSLRSCQGP